jgi:hypothetical protein
MRRFTALATFLFLLSVPVMAQETPEAEVFGGYSSFSNGAQTLNGWNASVNDSVNHWLGIKGDFSGFYKRKNGLRLTLHTFTFGPQLSCRKNRRVVPFFHALFGGAHASAGFQDLAYSDSSFAMNFGGGPDWVAHKNIAVRVVQLDVLVTRFGPDTSADRRISAGVVFRFGSK